MTDKTLTPEAYLHLKGHLSYIYNRIKFVSPCNKFFQEIWILLNNGDYQGFQNLLREFNELRMSYLSDKCRIDKKTLFKTLVKIQDLINNKDYISVKDMVDKICDIQPFTPISYLMAKGYGKYYRLYGNTPCNKFFQEIWILLNNGDYQGFQDLLREFNELRMEALKPPKKRIIKSRNVQT